MRGVGAKCPCQVNSEYLKPLYIKVKGLSTVAPPVQGVSVGVGVSVEGSTVNVTVDVGVAVAVAVGMALIPSREVADDFKEGSAWL